MPWGFDSLCLRMNLKKFNNGDNVVVTSTKGKVKKGQTGTIEQIDWMKNGKFWGYTVKLDNPQRGQDNMYLFRDYDLKKR